MPDPTSTRFPDFLVEHFSARINFRRTDLDSLLRGVGVELHDGGRIILLERADREGLHDLPDPTDEEIEIAQSGEPWTLWSSERSRFLTGLD